MHEMFKKKHVVSMRDLTREDVEFILDCAERMMPYAKTGVRVLQNRILALLFFEPSTEDAALVRLSDEAVGRLHSKLDFRRKLGAKRGDSRRHDKSS